MFNAVVQAHNEKPDMLIECSLCKTCACNSLQNRQLTVAIRLLYLFTHGRIMQLRRYPIAPPIRQRLYTPFAIVFAGDDQCSFCLPPSSFIEDGEPQH